jgi:hypothetical protein
MLLTLRGHFDLDASVYAGNRSECHNQFALIEKQGTRGSACLSSTGSEKCESLKAITNANGMKTLDSCTVLTEIPGANPSLPKGASHYPSMNVIAAAA